MFLKTWRFIALILSALVTGMALCHALELPAKMQYSAAKYIAMQNSLYVAFDPPNMGAFIKFAAPLVAIGLAILVRKRRPALLLTLVAIALMLLAFPVMFFVFTEPANVVFRNATPASIPVFCHLAAFSALVLSVLVETPVRYLPDRTEQPYAVLKD